jgi:hypothetical protein
MRRAAGFLIVLWLAACTPSLPDPATMSAVTAVPTLDTQNPEALCQAADEYKGRNWALTIDALEALMALRVVCTGGEAIDSRLYEAYLGYGTELEANHKLDAALRAYQTALSYDQQGQEAAARLARLQVATPVPPEQCEPSVAAEAIQTLQPYTPTEGSFIRIQDTSFVLEDVRYPVYGVNYYPREYPFGKFLTETPIEVFAAELDIIQPAGINTLRLFLRFQDLFTCPGNGAIPVPANFQRLDTMIQTAAQKGFRLILVLNADPDLAAYPLYDNPPHLIEQTRFLVQRYRTEPAILAWDVRDQGDLDYRSGDFSQEDVLTWVAETTRLIHQNDPNHPVTAGWWEEAQVTAPLVDFVSFHHYGEYEPLRQYIAILRDNVRDKPILLASIGYSTHTLDEIAQRNLLFQGLEEISNNRLAGWVIYLAFDFPRTLTCTPPDCPGEEREINRYGLWNTSYFPKLSVDAVKRVTGTP